MTTPKLQVRHLNKTFWKEKERLEVLRDVNLEIYDGEFIALVGASGCGKTTFLRMLDRLIEPTGGEILLDGRPVGLPGGDRGFVFQNDSLFPWRTVMENVRFGLEIQGRSKRDAEPIAARFIRLVGLAGFERHYPHELSGGMRQRVNLARALTVDPEVILMDEPFASLDSQTREIMQSELLKIWAEAHKTVVFVTHQIDEAVYLADRVVVFTVRPGRVKEVVPVRVPRPRSLSVKRTPAFVEQVDHIWNLIESEVREGMQAELSQSR